MEEILTGTPPVGGALSSCCIIGTMERPTSRLSNSVSYLLCAYTERLSDAILEEFQFNFMKFKTNDELHITSVNHIFVIRSDNFYQQNNHTLLLSPCCGFWRVLSSFKRRLFLHYQNAAGCK